MASCGRGTAYQSFELIFTFCSKTYSRELICHITAFKMKLRKIGLFIYFSVLIAVAIVYPPVLLHHLIKLISSRAGFTNSVQGSSDMIFCCCCFFFLPSYDLIFADLTATFDAFRCFL